MQIRLSESNTERFVLASARANCSVTSFVNQVLAVFSVEDMLEIAGERRIERRRRRRRDAPLVCDP